MNTTHFQYCPKLAVFDASGEKLLLCKRKGEQDYDGVFSLIGGKMEHKDPSIVEGIQREKNEEVGPQFSVRLLPTHSVDVLFCKKDGNRMILPHFYAQHIQGDVSLNDEYSEYSWVPLGELNSFSPMVENVRWIAPSLAQIARFANEDQYVVI